MNAISKPNEEYVICLKCHESRYPNRVPVIHSSPSFDDDIGIIDHCIFNSQIPVDLTRFKDEYRIKYVVGKDLIDVHTKKKFEGSVYLLQHK